MGETHNVFIYAFYNVSFFAFALITIACTTHVTSSNTLSCDSSLFFFLLKVLLLFCFSESNALSLLSNLFGCSLVKSLYI